MTKEIKIIPRGKQVLVKPYPKESNESEHGLLIPSNVEQEQKAFGTIISVGADVKDMQGAEGRRVIYAAFAGEKINLSGSAEEVDYVLLFDEDILAFIE